MFSIDSSRQADACRFCWMCRHICPVSNSTGNEGWTPRARGLMVSMIERGLPYDGEIAEAMYHCTLCDACANDCATGLFRGLAHRVHQAGIVASEHDGMTIGGGP